MHHLGNWPQCQRLGTRSATPALTSLLLEVHHFAAALSDQHLAKRKWKNKSTIKILSLQVGKSMLLLG
jgi:hypothetical protein